MRIGILGGGQLGKMLALSGYPLGLSFHFYDPDMTCCAKEIAPTTHATLSDLAALKKFANAVDIITYENENIPVESIQFLQSLKPLFPSLEAVQVTQDRLLEKECLQRLNIPTTPFMAMNDAFDLQQAADQLGFPFIVKTRRNGYDGKGQVVIRSLDELSLVDEAMLQCGCVAESWVNYRREFSVISVSSRSAETKYYDVCENVHQNGILYTTRNIPNDPALLSVQPFINALINDFSYVGVMTVEFFEDQDGRYLVNEIAPRVHNSGHWTIEGADTSQFQNHLRAGIDLPLGSTKSRDQVMMKNIIGVLPVLSDVLQDDKACLHLYAKSERAGRKLGHITFFNSD